jgi:hypothetical protein
MALQALGDDGLGLAARAQGPGRRARHHQRRRRLRPARRRSCWHAGRSCFCRRGQGANVDAKIEVAAARVADLDKQITAIDNAVAAATQRGKTQTALSAMEGQRKTRAVLADERNQAAAILAAAKAERAHVAAQGRIAETEATPIMYVAEMLGVGGDSGRAIRWLIALMVLCCDPLAIALTAAAAARR